MRSTSCGLIAYMTFITILIQIIPTGCRSYRPAKRSAESYYINPNRDLQSVGRVVLVELDNNSDYPQISTDVSEALYLALQKKQLFGLSIVPQDNPIWRSLQLDDNWMYRKQNSTSAKPSNNHFEELLAIQKSLKCNAIITGAITEYQPYPHMAIGLRLKLIDLRDGQLLWALEQVWDTADKDVERRIKNYFDSEIRNGYAPLREQLVIVSSLNFVKFVAYEVAKTLHP